MCPIADHQGEEEEQISTPIYSFIELNSNVYETLN